MPLVIAAAVFTGILAGLLLRGRLAAIGETRLRLWWLAVLALGTQVYLVRTVGPALPWWVPPVHVGSYVLLLLVVLVNRNVFGLPVIGLGLLMNLAVIAGNGGMMPQAPETALLRHPDAAVGEVLPRSKTVLLPREDTRLWWLSDHIVVPVGGSLPMVVSPGDFVLAAGLAATVCGLMRPAGWHRPISRSVEI